ncbi:hypothetical protein DDZ13_15210 [Coraliomargarita sinensis]|uniref:Uncharacterized protein n=1 Tax=Coraliomargarita sinensis TaxID=2174842 RepID=A0A317ZCG3_9BACT|nr:hypothetical protein [Coraliomargarita sinensis]PXA02815.1 hypothetical protein DDZ13_15210 [Coraliomargarita sinensis]
MKSAIITLLFSITLTASEPVGATLNGTFSPDLKKIRVQQEEIVKLNEHELGEELSKLLVDQMVQAFADSKMGLKIEFPHVVFVHGGNKYEGKITKYSDGLFLIEFNGGLLAPGYYESIEETMTFYSCEWKKANQAEVATP